MVDGWNKYMVILERENKEFRRVMEEGKDFIFL